MKKSILFVISLLFIFSMMLAACQKATEAPEEGANPGLQMESAQVAPQFWSEDEFNKEMDLMTKAPLNPEDPIYLQYLEEDPTDISQYPEYADFAAKEPPYNICFSNAGVNNPWRVVGYIDIREQVEELRAEGLVQNFYHLDAQGDDAKQIADIQDSRRSGYIKSLAESAVFTDDLITSDMASQADTDTKAIVLGINAEKDSLLLYYEMKNILPQRMSQVIDRIIEEEKTHLLQLAAIKNEMSGEA